MIFDLRSYEPFKINSRLSNAFDLSHQSALKQFGADELGLFYFPYNEWQNEYDVQIIGKCEEGHKKLHTFLNLANYLENIMGRKVDLLSWDGVTCGLKRSIDDEVELFIY